MSAGRAIQGVELSRRFYAEVVRPWLARDFADLPHAAALIGYGSELRGVDDEMSRDHDWGPRVSAARHEPTLPPTLTP